MRERPFTFATDPGVAISGTLCLPEDAGEGRRVPAILLLGGTFGDTRDGDMDLSRNPYAADAPKNGLLRRFAHALVERGVASLRYDRRGCGESDGPFDPRDPASDMRDALAAARALRAVAEVDPSRVGAAGHSAGASRTCEIARELPDTACAGLLGMLYGTSEDLVRWNWSRLAAYWPRLTDERREWLKAHRARDVAAAFNVDAFIAAVGAGRDSIRLAAEGVSHEFELVGFRKAMERARTRPRDEQLADVRCPALLLHGAEDLNVPVQDSLESFRAMRRAGNRRLELVIVPGVDHNYQVAPDDEVERVWERASFRSQANAVSRAALDGFAAWAERVLHPAG